MDKEQNRTEPFACPSSFWPFNLNYSYLRTSQTVNSLLINYYWVVVVVTMRLLPTSLGIRMFPEWVHLISVPFHYNTHWQKYDPTGRRNVSREGRQKDQEALKASIVVVHNLSSSSSSSSSIEPKSRLCCGRSIAHRPWSSGEALIKLLSVQGAAGKSGRRRRLLKLLHASWPETITQTSSSSTTPPQLLANY